MTDTATLALPDHVLAISEFYGINFDETLFVLEEVTDGSGEESEISGVIFGAWSAGPPEIPLAFGPWSGTLTSYDVDAPEDWSA